MIYIIQMPGLDTINGGNEVEAYEGTGGLGFSMLGGKRRGSRSRGSRSARRTGKRCKGGKRKGKRSVTMKRRR